MAFRNLWIILLVVVFISNCRQVELNDKLNASSASQQQDADLSMLTLQDGTLSPSFTPGTTIYTALVKGSSFTIIPTAKQADAKVTVNGVPFESESPAPSFPIPSNLHIQVVAQDGVTKKPAQASSSTPIA